MKKIGDNIFYLSKMLKSITEHKLMNQSIGIGQLQVLMTLKSNQKKTMTQKDLSMILNVDKGNISRSTRKLLANGYIKIENSATNNQNIEITHVGQLALEDMFPLLQDISDSMTKEILEEDLKIYEKVMKKMIRNLEEY